MIIQTNVFVTPPDVDGGLESSAEDQCNTFSPVRSDQNFVFSEKTLIVEKM